MVLELALRHFSEYVSSPLPPALVYSDHNPLTFLQKMKKKNRRLLNWSLLLQDFNLEIVYIRGLDNVCADALAQASYIFPYIVYLL